MKDRYLETEFGEVFAKAAGDPGHPLVLGLHGWSQRNGWHTWEPLLAPLAAAGFYVVSVDMPGWGKSVPVGPGPMLPEQAVTAVTAILDALQLAAPPILMGKSWGGGLALSLALAHPQRAGKLILTAPAFHQLDQLPNLTQPVLLAWAEDDPVIPIEVGTTMAAAIPACRLVTYPTGGHSAAPKNAAAFAPEAVRFLKHGGN